MSDLFDKCIAEILRYEEQRKEQLKAIENRLSLYSTPHEELWKPIIPSHFQTEDTQLPSTRSSLDFSGSGILHNLEIPHEPGKYLVKYSQGDRSFWLKVKISTSGTVRFKAKGRMRIW